MSDIKLTSKEYCESVFVDGPKFDKLSAFVSGPDAQVQGKLTASTGINLNNNTISVNTASSVGTSTLPVTASAVNTKLSSYVNNVSSPDGSITVSKSGSSVTLKANASGGSKWIHDDTVSSKNTLTLGYGDSGQVDSIFVVGPMYDEGKNIILNGKGKTAGEYDYIAIGAVNVNTYGGGCIAIGTNADASEWYNNIAIGKNATSNGQGSVVIGENAKATGYALGAIGPQAYAKGSSFAIGPYAHANAGGGMAIGSGVRNNDYGCIAIGGWRGTGYTPGQTVGQATQLYLIQAGSWMAEQYSDGEAALGYIVTDTNADLIDSSEWTIIKRGTRKLSELLTDHTTDFTPDLSRNQW